MSDNQQASEKSEEPTEKKLKDSKEKGQVAKSKEVVSTSLIVFLVSYLYIARDFYFEKLSEIILLPSEYAYLPFEIGLIKVRDGLLLDLLYLVIPFALIALLVGIVANVIQFGFVFAVQPIKPEFKKINPVEGFKRIFSIKSLVEFFKSILKVFLLTLLVVIVLKSNMNDLLYIPQCGIGCILPLVGKILKELMIIIFFGFMIISVADYFFEVYQHRKQLRMTKDEVKREYKETEGNPEIKGKRRQFHHEIQSGAPPPRKNVKRSSVLVTNPTHIAIGILYDKVEEPFPIITFKAIEKEAFRLIDYAKQEGVPVIQKIPLARGLYEFGEEEEPIPAEFIKPVAEVLKWAQSIEKYAHHVDE